MILKIVVISKQKDTLGLLIVKKSLVKIRNAKIFVTVFLKFN